MKEKIIFHIDVNNAFLSWSAVYLLKEGFNKDIRNIPSIIGGSEKERKGIVLAKSPVAKKYGIRTAETIYSARKKCPSLEIYPANYSWYSKKSKELMAYLLQYSPEQEQISIDECYLDMSGMKYLHKDLKELAYKIKNEIKEKFGYTVNIGIANNKLCAKMASDFEKPDKVHTLFNNEIVTKLWPLKVEKLYMCGKRTTQELNKLNITTIEDLAKANPKLLEKHFKSQAKYLKNAAMGIGETKLNTEKHNNLSISTTETLPYNINNRDKLKEIIFRQVEEVSRELRSKKLYVKTIAIIFKNNNFKSYSAQTTLDNPTNTTKKVLKTAYQVFDNNYQDDNIRLIGVRLANLVKQPKKQISLFAEIEGNNETEKAIQTTVDSINNHFGKSIIKPASLNIIGESKSKKRYFEKKS